MVLGALPDARYERGYVQLEVGSTVLLYTDGIIETAAPGDAGRRMLGLGPLREILADRGERTARQIVEAVFDRARRFGGSDTPADDQTVVAVRRISEIDPVRY
jgi:serine phosphatase RsbU (regulator of sigma subunit)